MTLRPVLATLPAYVPGRTVPGAIKLASNETPYPPLPHVVERITAAAVDAHRYPDNGSAAVVQALAAHYDVDPAQVAVGNGSVALCTQLVQAVADADDQVMYAWRSFEAYPIITAVSGASSTQVPLTDGYVHDLDEMAARVTGKTRLIFVCNPNNPTGTVVDRDALVRFLRAVPSDTIVALDEAYFEFTDGADDPDVPDGLSLLAEFDNLVVLRTFSKAYGLAGLRVGYAIAADPAIAVALRQTQVPFAVTSVAQAAAIASLEPAAQEQMRERAAEVRSERVRVREALLAAGYDVPTTQANFVWLPLGERTVEWAQACEDHGVIVRAFAGSGVRVTISSPAENNRFLSVLATIS